MNRWWGCLKRIIAPLAPDWAVKRYRDTRTLIALLHNISHDTVSFIWHSGIMRSCVSRSSLRALITMDYHAIEKGLALPKPRDGFGQHMVRRLVENTQQYLRQYGHDDLTRIVNGCLLDYLAFHRENPDAISTLSTEIKALIQSLEDHDRSEHAAVIRLTKRDVLADARIDGERFFRSRYSIRNFADAEVDEALIRRAVSLAQKTPSVCNRQCGRVHLLAESEKIQQCLALQGGARGFGDKINKLLICTADTTSMVLVGERNQHWVDGGMFAMSLVYALHSLGLGTCFLNWSKTFGSDHALRKLCQIPWSERVVVMIAVGHLPESLLVAQSARLPIEQVLTVHEYRAEHFANSWRAA